MITPKINFIVISHKFVTQPDDDLVLYLNNNKTSNVMHVTHSFSDSPNRISICKWYKNGNTYKEWKSRDHKSFPEPIIYLRELIFTIISIVRSRLFWDNCVCMDGLCTFYGLVAKVLFRVNKVVYWAIDFVPENRFKSKLKNFIYHSINKIGYKEADEMWDLSPRMADAREKFLGIKIKDYKKHKVVPYGVWIDRIKKYSYEECEKNTLVFMGHLLEKQGVQLVLKAIPEIVERKPDFKFKIIGAGNYKSNLEKLTDELNIRKYVIFTNGIKDDTELEDEVAKSCVAIAPYIKNLDTWTYYADPGKVKKYLGCGVPVLLTDVPWNAKEIEVGGCGNLILEDFKDIAKNVINLMNGSINQEFRDNANIYSKSFDYQKIFNNLKL